MKFSFNAAETSIVAGNDDGVVYVLRLPDFKVQQTIQAPQTVSCRFAFAPLLTSSTADDWRRFHSAIQRMYDVQHHDQVPDLTSILKFSLLAPIVFGADINQTAN